MPEVEIDRVGPARLVAVAHLPLEKDILLKDVNQLNQYAEGSIGRLNN